MLVFFGPAGGELRQCDAPSPCSLRLDSCLWWAGRMGPRRRDLLFLSRRKRVVLCSLGIRCCLPPLSPFVVLCPPHVLCRRRRKDERCAQPYVVFACVSFSVVPLLEILWDEVLRPPGSWSLPFPLPPQKFKLRPKPSVCMAGIFFLTGCALDCVCHVLCCITQVKSLHF